MWLRDLLVETGEEQGGPSTLWIDNSGAVAIANDAGSVGRSRHISRRANFLQEASAAGLLRMQWLSTDHLAADLLTKPLDRRRFAKLRGWMMGERATPQPTCAGASSEQQHGLSAPNEFDSHHGANPGAPSTPALGRTNETAGDLDLPARESSG